MGMKVLSRSEWPAKGWRRRQAAAIQHACSGILNWNSSIRQVLCGGDVGLVLLALHTLLLRGWLLDVIRIFI